LLGASFEKLGAAGEVSWDKGWRLEQVFVLNWCFGDTDVGCYNRLPVDSLIVELVEV
jgi:hypothetical protein